MSSIILIFVTGSMAWLLFITTFLFCPFYISSTLGLDSFPGGVIRTFIPDMSVLFVILPGLGCCSFPLTFIMGHGRTRKHLKQISTIETYLSYLHIGKQFHFLTIVYTQKSTFRNEETFFSILNLIFNL